MINYNNETDETFTLDQPELNSYLYFPLANENSLMNSITPDLSGDSKISQNAFLMAPVSSENLHNDKSSRNIWCKVNDTFWWSTSGKSSHQQAKLFTDEKESTTLEAGFMHHILRRTSNFGLEAEVINFVPSTGEQMELMGVTLTNTSKKPMTIEVMAAIPIYGRSADNIRDHRHVTALLHRIETTSYGVVVNPTMSFDERGHQMNSQIYGVFGGSNQIKPQGFIPTLEDFIGEGGNLENPKVLSDESLNLIGSHECTAGYEALGGIAFQKRTLESGENLFLCFALGYGDDHKSLEDTALHFFNKQAFLHSLEGTKNYWRAKVNVTYHTGDPRFNPWMKWVSFQPFLRRIYGCSFLPHHDYGKGGRGWRDLWQDCLALLIMDPHDVRQMLVDNFGGIRLDGTNATIIGFGQGEFIADRNNISRVWMDHGMWPFLTTNLYIEQTGDLDILLEDAPYFHDMQSCRGERKNLHINPKDNNKLVKENGDIYLGSILEHVLIEHLTAFYDVGEHNHMRLRGADWNDALDMASERGESVAFTAMYAHNMEEIARYLAKLQDSGLKEVDLYSGLQLLLTEDDFLYRDPNKKQDLLLSYCLEEFHGKKVKIKLHTLIENLKSKAHFIKEHIRQTEWILTQDNYGWYNGYYDNHGEKVEGEFQLGIRMMLTSQVFTLMSGTAKETQVDSMVNSSNHYLYDSSVGGYKLNTNFNEVKMDLGRMFGFAYGHKENGAVFSHMTVMYSYALYQRGRSDDAYQVISSLYHHCDNFEKSRIYPGIPEYVNSKGRGMYHYLTGSASWMLLTVITQMFGVRGKMGDLEFKPQLLLEQFDERQEAKLDLLFQDKKLQIIYKNPNSIEVGSYKIKNIVINGEDYLFNVDEPLIKKDDLKKLDDKETHTITVMLK